jgi:hypothetical protein
MGESFHIILKDIALLPRTHDCSSGAHGMKIAKFISRFLHVKPADSLDTSNTSAVVDAERGWVLGLSLRL